MTAAEKFAVCRALFESQIGPAPMAAHQFRMTVNAVAEVVCPRPDDNAEFRRLCGKDNWIGDNPFVDD